MPPTVRLQNREMMLPGEWRLCLAVTSSWKQDIFSVLSDRWQESAEESHVKFPQWHLSLHLPASKKHTNRLRRPPARCCANISSACSPASFNCDVSHINTSPARTAQAGHSRGGSAGCLVASNALNISLAAETQPDHELNGSTQILHDVRLLPPVPGNDERFSRVQINKAKQVEPCTELHRPRSNLDSLLIPELYFPTHPLVPL